MKIQEVIKECDTLYENAVPKEQKIKWCDELGALLKNEYAKTYQRTLLEKKDQAFLLPAGTDMARVAMFIADGKEVAKAELARWGYTILPDSIYGKQGLPPIYRLSILYQEPYVPITDVQVDETVAYTPYDRMYIEYLIAKCNYYNRDFEGYNQHMNYFNSILKGFGEDFIRKNAPIRREIVGWWK